MIGNDGRAILTDVGMQPLTDQLYLDSSGHVPLPDSWAYKPAEEFSVDNIVEGVIVHEKPADVYCFGTVSHAVSA